MSEEFVKITRTQLKDLVAGYCGSSALGELYELASAPPQPDHSAQMYTCIGKGGSYAWIGTALGAGMHRGDIIEVYRGQNGQLYFRETAEFFERMERIEAQPLDTVQGDAQAELSSIRISQLTVAIEQSSKAQLENYHMATRAWTETMELQQRLATAEQLLRDTMSELRNPLHTGWEDDAADRIEAYLAASAKPEGGEA